MKWSDLCRGQAVEMEYGMKIELVGSRWLCRWEAEDLRRYSLEHVLQHEVGHHVHAMQRQRQGMEAQLSRRVKE